MDCPAPLLPFEILEAHFLREIDGLSYRQAATAAQVEPSTMMRRVRCFEEIQDHPLVRAALPGLAAAWRNRDPINPPAQDRPFRLVSDLVERLHRRNPDLITARHVALAAGLRAAPRPEAQGDVPPLGPRLAAVLDLAVRQDRGIEEIEDRCRLPARSGRLALAFALDLFDKHRAAAPRPERTL